MSSNNVQGISIISLVAMLLILSGCSSIHEEEARAVAVDFVQTNVKFFLSGNESKMEIPEYKIDSVSSYREKNGWQVAMHVYATIGNETKQNDILVTVSSEGKAVALNGKPIPPQP